MVKTALTRHLLVRNDHVPRLDQLCARLSLVALAWLLLAPLAFLAAPADALIGSQRWHDDPTPTSTPGVVGFGSECFSVADQFGQTVDDGLFAIDRFSGAVRVIGSGTGTAGIEAIAFGPGSGVEPTLYAFDYDVFGVLDVESGLFEAVAAGLPDPLSDIDGLHFDVTRDVFWVSNRTRRAGVADQLFAVDVSGEVVAAPVDVEIAVDPDFVTGEGLDEQGSTIDELAVEATDVICVG